jgi:DNA invertase Pin-like site-specific DNA recombinase
MSKVIGYIRVSSKSQKLDRQMDEMLKQGIASDNIYQDEASGKDLDRVGYQYMRRALSSGDTLVIKSLDRLGRNKNDIKAEWAYYKDMGVHVRILDMPMLDKFYSEHGANKELMDSIGNIIFELMAWQAQEERERIKVRQAEGIASAKLRNKDLGRPKADLSTIDADKFAKGYAEWKAGNMTAVTFMTSVGLKKSNFYKVVKEYEQPYKGISVITN